MATVKFSLQKEERISLKVLDINGKIIWQTAPERLPAGEHSRPIDLKNLPAGTYGILLETARGRVGKLVVKQ